MDIDVKDDILQHPDYPQEKEHLEQTITAMKAKLEGTEEAVNNTRELINRVARGQDTTSHVDISVEAMLVARKLEEAEEVSTGLDKPYFGRIDYQDDDYDYTETLYIGKRFDGPTELAVYDWRTPIAGLFYQGKVGPVTYKGNGRNYSGELQLIRKYEISKGILQNFLDDSILQAVQKMVPTQPGSIQEDSVEDEFLLKRLKQSADKKLKDIVETIRAEQYEIISEPWDNVVIVQGVAGSGKSTIALHRVSYLLYHHSFLKPENIVFVAPNKIFLDYISSVLPDLDASGVAQFTFEKLASDIIKTKLKIVKDDETTKEIRLEISQFKGSEVYRQALVQYIEAKVQSFTVKLTDISLFDDKFRITKQEQMEFMLDSEVPFNQRLERLRRFVESKIDIFLDVSDGIQQPSTLGLLTSVTTMGYRQRVKEDYESKQLWEQRDRALARLTVLRRQFSSEYFQGWESLDVLSSYAEFLAGREFLGQHATGLVKNGEVEVEDLAALCYLKFLVDGFDHVKRYSHIVVDEAQDLSILQLIVLKLLAQHNSFTLVGDLAQGIGAFGIRSWQTVIREVFRRDKVKLHHVRKSYRSTKQIVEFANRVLPKDSEKAIPVHRQGPEPLVQQAKALKDRVKQVTESINQCLEAGCQSVAILGKTDSECKEIQQLLRAELPTVPYLMTGETVAYQGGVSIAPITLAKGLEFDAVIVWDVSANSFGSATFDAKLLYVALTRPLHYLYLFYGEKLTPLLEK